MGGSIRHGGGGVGVLEMYVFDEFGIGLFAKPGVFVSPMNSVKFVRLGTFARDRSNLHTLRLAKLDA